VRCIELGAEDFIFKPFNPTLLRARVMATLEKKALRDQTREELRRKQAELNEARILQLALTPPNLRHSIYGHTIAIDVVLEPAKEVGGDLVDYFPVADDLLVLALGDVSDKGAGAALMMARTHALVRSLAGRPDASALFTEPERATELVNKSLARQNDNCMFITFCLATLNSRTRSLSVVRAGHVPPLVRRADGRVERLRAAGGVPLGLDGDAVFKSETISLAPGDRVLIVTDGFTEAADRAGSLFGDERVELFLAELDVSDPEPLDRLTRLVRAFEDGQQATDDRAAVMLSLSRAGDA
jgi:sigma-B regulation protein RsbU (phosphoserine phosphatase)